MPDPMTSQDLSPTAERAFHGTKDSIAKARAWLRTWLEKFAVPEAAAEDAVLVLSELTTNAALHSEL
jgi:anti-sigma regulatory factor (Ser/Thr protein kinase)